jgi:hypothetical protein
MKERCWLDHAAHCAWRCIESPARPAAQSSAALLHSSEMVLRAQGGCLCVCSGRACVCSGRVCVCSGRACVCSGRVCVCVQDVRVCVQDARGAERSVLGTRVCAHGPGRQREPVERGRLGRHALRPSPPRDHVSRRAPRRGGRPICTGRRRNVRPVCTGRRRDVRPVCTGRRGDVRPVCTGEGRGGGDSGVARHRLREPRVPVEIVEHSLAESGVAADEVAEGLRAEEGRCAGQQARFERAAFPRLSR